MKIGFARMDITPPLPCVLGGYIKRSKPADRMHSPLFCRCMAGADHGAHFGIISLDLLGVDARLRDEICRRLREVMPIEPERISILATHTHSAIDGVPDFLHKGLWTVESDHIPVLYRQQLVEMIVSCMTAASNAAREARLQWLKTECPGIAGNRRDATKAVDHEVHLLKVYDTDSSQVAGGMLHFACHPTVIGPEENVISADFPGAALEELERQFEGSIFLFANGAAGDISTRYTRQGSDPEEAERVGKRLFKSLHHLEEMPIPEAGYRVSVIPIVFKDRWNGNQVQSMLQRIELGGMQLWMVPGELFSSYAMELKERDRRNLLIGFANDYIGYIPDEEAWETGGYEVDVSRLRPDDITKIRRCWL